jgi:hypothetical protein
LAGGVVAQPTIKMLINTVIKRTQRLLKYITCIIASKIRVTVKLDMLQSILRRCALVLN